MTQTVSRADNKDRIVQMIAFMAFLIAVLSASEAAEFWAGDTPVAALVWIKRGALGGLVFNVLLMIWRMLDLRVSATGAAVHEEDGVLISLLHRSALVAFGGTVIAMQMDNLMARLLPEESIRLFTLITLAWMLGLFSLSFLVLNLHLFLAERSAG